MSINYEFDYADVERFASRSHSRIRKSGKEAQFMFCPYCEGGAHKDKWTFSISLIDGRYTCQRSSCPARGNMITLARDFAFSLNETVDRYFNINDYNNKFKKFKDAHKAIESKIGAIEYLSKRGIPEHITTKYEVTTNDKGNIVFPFKDHEGELKFIKYRNPNHVKGVTDGSKEWCEPNCMPILFGMNHCNLENKTLVMTEGQIDSLSVATAGIENAVSVPTGMNGFTWVPHCWDWMQNFDNIIIFGDLENGNISLLEEMTKRFNKKVSHVRVCDYKDCKDANEILQKYGESAINDCINNAVQMPIKKVISLSDVEPINIYDLPKLKTGLNDLDRLLCGGLPFGGVTLISGKPGEGKSTLASQILLSAIDQGKKCFAYSGELPNHIFKEWLDFQAAGRFVSVTGHESNPRYEIAQNVRRAINDWYKDKCYLYDNTALDDDTEEETLCSLIENAVVRYGCDVVLIDNLMTALDIENIKGYDKYDNQSRFVKKLTKLALKHNILIMLVAHKRKNNVSVNENDEIAGSGDISNLAMVTLSYQKGGRDDMTTEQRLLKVSKNRLFGKVETTGWITNYSESCRRIYLSIEELEKDYGFKVDDGGFLPVPEDAIEDIPF